MAVIVLQVRRACEIFIVIESPKTDSAVGVRVPISNRTIFN